MMYLALRWDRPAGESGPRVEVVPGQGQLVDGVFANIVDSEIAQQLYQSHAMQYIQLGPGELAGADLVHVGLVLAPPAVGEGAPVGIDAVGLAKSLAVLRDRAAPVHDRAEDIEDQCPYSFHVVAPPGMFRVFLFIRV